MAAERVRQALLGRMRAAEEWLAAEVDAAFRFAMEVPVGKLPAWADAGAVNEVGRFLFSKHTLDLDVAESADGVEWPPITVMVFQVSDEPASVLTEVGSSGMPQQLRRRLAGRRGVGGDAADKNGK